MRSPPALSITPSNFEASSGSPITPVEARKTSDACAPVAFAAKAAVSFAASLPLCPVKALALPELTTSARALPALQLGAAPIDGRRRTFRSGEHAGDLRALVHQRQAAHRCAPCSGCRPRPSRSAPPRSPADRDRISARAATGSRTSVPICPKTILRHRVAVLRPGSPAGWTADSRAQQLERKVSRLRRGPRRFEDRVRAKPRRRNVLLRQAHAEIDFRLGPSDGSAFRCGERVARAGSTHPRSTGRLQWRHAIKLGPRYFGGAAGAGAAGLGVAPPAAPAKAPRAYPARRSSPSRARTRAGLLGSLRE